MKSVYRYVITFAAVLLAIAGIWMLYERCSHQPWTRDGQPC